MSHAQARADVHAAFSSAFANLRQSGQLHKLGKARHDELLAAKESLDDVHHAAIESLSVHRASHARENNMAMEDETCELKRRPRFLGDAGPKYSETAGAPINARCQSAMRAAVRALMGPKTLSVNDRRATFSGTQDSVLDAASGAPDSPMRAMSARRQSEDNVGLSARPMRVSVAGGGGTGAPLLMRCSSSGAALRPTPLEGPAAAVALGGVPGVAGAGSRPQSAALAAAGARSASPFGAARMLRQSLSLAPDSSRSSPTPMSPVPLLTRVRTLRAVTAGDGGSDGPLTARASEVNTPVHGETSEPGSRMDEELESAQVPVAGRRYPWQGGGDEDDDTSQPGRRSLEDGGEDPQPGVVPQPDGAGAAYGPGLRAVRSARVGRTSMNLIASFKEQRTYEEDEDDYILQLRNQEIQNIKPLFAGGAKTAATAAEPVAGEDVVQTVSWLMDVSAKASRRVSHAGGGAVPPSPGPTPTGAISEPHPTMHQLSTSGVSAAYSAMTNSPNSTRYSPPSAGAAGAVRISSTDIAAEHSETDPPAPASPRLNPAGSEWESNSAMAQIGAVSPFESARLAAATASLMPQPQKPTSLGNASLPQATLLGRVGASVHDIAESAGIFFEAGLPTPGSKALARYSLSGIDQLHPSPPSGGAGPSSPGSRPQSSRIRMSHSMGRHSGATSPAESPAPSPPRSRPLTSRPSSRITNSGTASLGRMSIASYAD